MESHGIELESRDWTFHRNTYETPILIELR
jgi:hypothetical protein